MNGCCWAQQLRAYCLLVVPKGLDKLIPLMLPAQNSRVKLRGRAAVGRPMLFFVLLASIEKRLYWTKRVAAQTQHAARLCPNALWHFNKIIGRANLHA